MTEPKSTALTLSIDFDLVGAEAMRLLEQASTAPLSDATDVILSLRRVSAIDVSGVAALVRLHSRLRRNGSRLFLTEARPDIVSRLEAIGLSRAVPHIAPLVRDEVSTAGRLR